MTSSRESENYGYIGLTKKKTFKELSSGLEYTLYFHKCQIMTQDIKEFENEHIGYGIVLNIEKFIIMSFSYLWKFLQWLTLLY